MNLGKFKPHLGSKPRTAGTQGRCLLRSAVFASFVTAVLLTSGCAGSQSSLDPAGPQSRHIFGLAQLFFWVCVGVYTVVLAVLVGALLRGRFFARVADEEPIAEPHPRSERRLLIAVGAATGVTVILLFVLLAGDVVTERSLQSLDRSDSLTITVTGQQWWWKAQYEHHTPSQVVVTANEIHLPVGRPVHLKLQSTDVIHSFWVPNLHGKRDLIPGHPTSLWLKADRPGTYRGQCAEFCGLQHAHMRFVVVVEPVEEFEAWLESQRRPAAEPATSAQERGRDIFLSTTCIMCHTVRGTPAFGDVGPDLTHLASRKTIAAGSLPNTPGHLAGWIVDPQRVKFGVRMPQHSFSPEDLRALLAYLESLK